MTTDAKQPVSEATMRRMLDVLLQECLVQPTMASLVRNLADKLNHRVADRLQVEAIVFSNVHGVLGMTSGADELKRVFNDRKDGS